MSYLPTALGTSFLLLITGILSLNFLINGPFSATICSILALCLLLPFLIKMIYDDLRMGKKQMNELALIATIAATLQGNYAGYLTASAIAFILILSLLIERRSAKGANFALESITELTVGKVVKLINNQEVPTQSDLLKIGDIIRVKSHEVIMVDGTILNGKSAIQESNITGESLPQDKGDGDKVFAGTINLTAFLDIRVENLGENTALGKVKNLILDAENTRPECVRLIDSCARFYTPMILMFALMVFIAYDYDLNRVVTLLVAACPIALVLSTPSSAIAALSAAARVGVLIKKVSDLERLSSLKTFLFDKTGTLTTGELEVVKLVPNTPHTAENLLRLAVCACIKSNHPVSQAVVTLAQQVKMPIDPSEAFQEYAGRGHQIILNKEKITCGNANFLKEQGIKLDFLNDKINSIHGGASLLFVAKSSEVIGFLALKDQIRSDAKKVLTQLKEEYETINLMITGDREAAAKDVAQALGISECYFECKPSDKIEKVKAFSKLNEGVVFIGDGVNDGPALAASEVGIAMGAAGQSVALQSADMALMNNELDRLLFIKKLSQQYRRIMIENLTIGFCLIIAGIIFAMTMPKIQESQLMYGAIISAFIQLFGALVVIFNSARLLRVKLN